MDSKRSGLSNVWPVAPSTASGMMELTEFDVIGDANPKNPIKVPGGIQARGEKGKSVMKRLGNVRKRIQYHW